MTRDSQVGRPEDPVWREVRRLWGDQLAPISPDFVGWNVSDFTRSFLTGIGLPTECPLLVTFYHDERLLKPLSMGGTNYFVVGDDYGTVLGINLETDELWAVDPNEQLPQCFVNSRVSDFVLFLALWESRQPDLEEATTEGIKGIIRQLRWQFNSRDKHALENVVNWWNDVLNDVIRSLRE